VNLLDYILRGAIWGGVRYFVNMLFRAIGLR